MYILENHSEQCGKFSEKCLKLLQTQGVEEIIPKTNSKTAV